MLPSARDFSSSWAWTEVSRIGPDEGFERKLNLDDDDADMDPIIKKVLNAKLFEDDNGGLWKQSVKECNGEILCSASRFC